MASPLSKPISTEDWAQVWKAAGPRLAEIERRELGAMTEADRRTAVQALLMLVPVWTDAPATSGLVEQQKWFRKLTPPRAPY